MSYRESMLAAVSALALAAGVPALAADPATMPAMPTTPATEDPANPASMVPLKVDMQTFVTGAAISDMFEVKAAEIAATRSRTAGITDFAAAMKTAHTETTVRLTPLAATAGATIPTALDQTHQDMLTALTDAKDDAFDRTYIDQQVSGHETAVALFKGYAATGDNEQLMAFAKETAPAIEKHLDHAKQLQKDLDSATAPNN